jgi:ceramide glucosyltransferase
MLIAACLIALGYQLTALIATLRHMRRREQATGFQPPVSILKPVHGLDPGFAQAIRSHAEQQYPEFEILLGVSDDNDPAIPQIERLQAEFPPLRLIRAHPAAGNQKVGVLQELAAQARYDVLLVNDSDIGVPACYLRDVVAPLADEQIGLVTCLYRATSASWPGIWEAVGIATDFAPSTLVAPLVGVKEFGLGSTLVFRAGDLAAIGGFESIADYLADDYQLAKRLCTLGKRVHLSKVVVETSLRGESWSQVWHHQVRWHRTIRVSRGAYAGLPVTQASLWALLAAVAGMWWLAGLVLLARMAMAATAGIGVLRCPLVKRYFWIIPFRDLWGVAVWAAGLFGNTVRWRNQQLRLSEDGRIQP